MSTFIIRNKTTHEQWVASSGKNSWKKSNHAKAAFANSSGKTKHDPLLQEFVSKLKRYDALKFNDQDVYEVIEVYSNNEKRAAEIERKFEVVKTLMENNSSLYKGDFYPEGIEHQRCLELLCEISDVLGTEN